MLIRILKGLLLTAVVLLVLLAATLGYLFQHPEIITEKVENWYESNYMGDLQLGKLTLSSWREWPNATLNIHDLSLTDTTQTHSTAPTLLIEELAVKLSLAQVFQREVILENLVIKGGHFRSLTDKDGDTNTNILQALSPTASGWRNGGMLHLKNLQSLALTINDFELVLDNALKNKQFAGYIENIAAQLTLSDTLITSDMVIDACVEGLGFNLDKGSYMENTTVGAHLQVQYDRQLSTIEIPQFPIQLNDQTFFTETCLDLAQEGVFFLSLFNQQTDFQVTKALLPLHLQNKLAPYQIFRPLATAISLRGEFVDGDNPWVHIDFTAPGNTVIVDGTLAFENVNGSGSFVNRISEDPTIAKSEDRRNLKLSLQDLHCEYLGAQLYLENSTFQSTPQVPTTLDLQLHAKGRLDDLNAILGNENFFFAGGHFDAQLKMEGAAESLADVLKRTEGKLFMQNTKVHYLPAEVTVPLTELDVILSPEHALVPSIRIPLAEGQEIKISGLVKNFSALIFEEKNEKVESDLAIYSADLNLDNFLDLVASLQESSEVDSSQVRISETVKGIYSTFHPCLSLSIDQFTYQTWQAHGIRSQLSFVNDHVLKIDSTVLYSAQSQLMLNGTFSIPDSTQSSRINIAIEARGDTEDFNKTFANDTFLFQEGDYHFQGKLNGKIQDWRDLLYATRGHLQVQKTGIFFVPQALNFHVALIDLDVAQHDITLNTLQLTLPSGGSLALNGKVDNFMDILAEKESPLVQSFIGLQASYLDYADFSGLFSSLQKSETSTVNTGSNQIKKSLFNLYHKFHPELDIQIDSFQHKDVLVTDLSSKVAFEGSSKLQFADMTFEYRDSPVQLNASLRLNQDTVTPVDLSLTTAYFDLGTLVETYDYFGLAALQSADKIAGKVSLNAHLKGQLHDATGLDPKRLLGAVQFTLHEAELVNFEPIQKIGEQFFRTERFESIRFAPVTDTLYITQEVIHIPRMEIQSTAFNLFLEGHLNYDNNTNLWISVPWRNFNAWEEGNVIPPKTGYYRSGAKLYVEVKGNDDNGIDYKFRLRKKQLYLHQGIGPLYRQDLKFERQRRRLIRRENRAARREKV